MKLNQKQNNQLLQFIQTLPKQDPKLIKDIIVKWKIFLLQQEDSITPTNLVTGILSLDHVIGGLSTGITQIYGPEASYKTALLLQLSKKLSDIHDVKSIFMNTDNKDLDLTFAMGQNVTGNVKSKNGSYRSSEYIKEVVLKNAVTNSVFVDSITNLHRFRDFLKTAVKLKGHVAGFTLFFSNQSRKSFTDKKFEGANADSVNSFCENIIRVEKVEKYNDYILVHYLLEKSYILDAKPKRFIIHYTSRHKISNLIYLLGRAEISGKAKKSINGYRVGAVEINEKNYVDNLATLKILYETEFPDGEKFEYYFQK